jgi:hypothetical protein
MVKPNYVIKDFRATWAEERFPTPMRKTGKLGATVGQS